MDGIVHTLNRSGRDFVPLAARLRGNRETVRVDLNGLHAPQCLGMPNVEYRFGERS